MERITRHFQEELDLLKTRLLEMGGLAEERVRHSVQGLADRDFALIEAVLGGDEPVNQIHIEVDDRVLKLLAEDMLHANRATLRQLSEQLLNWATPRADAPPPDLATDPAPSGDSLTEAAAAQAAERGA